jgi:hypothetical protein
MGCWELLPVRGTLGSTQSMTAVDLMPVLAGLVDRALSAELIGLTDGLFVFEWKGHRSSLVMVTC